MIHIKIEQLLQTMSSLEFLDDPPETRPEVPYTKLNPKQRPGFSRTLYWHLWHPSRRPPRPSDMGLDASLTRATHHDPEIDTGLIHLLGDPSGQMPPSSVVLAG